MIAVEEMVISITASGYVKRLPVSTYRTQHRGGIGRHGHGPQRGRLHRAPLHHHHPPLPALHHLAGQDLPAEGARAAAGQPAEQGTARGQPAAAGPGREDQGGHRHQGLHRRQVPGLRHRRRASSRRPASSTTPPRSRPTASSPSTSRTTTSWWRCGHTSGHDDLILVSSEGKAIRFHEYDVRPTGRNTMGVHGHAHARAATCWSAWRWPRTTPTSSASPAAATASARPSPATPRRSGAARASSPSRTAPTGATWWA